MREAKILLATNSSGDQFNYYRSELIGGITDWEEVTEEELSWLRQYLPTLKPPLYGFHYILIVKDEQTIQFHLESIRKLVIAEKERQDKEKAKKEEINKRRQETRRKNQEEKERKLLEQLKGKYEDG